jgi:hypothetical protein
MAMVDERGRLFGRWNLLDLAVLILLLGLIPLGYGAYVLFRDRPPTIVSVTPNHIQEAQELQLTIKGTNLRPYMRVSAGAQQARDFVFRNTEEAQLPFAYLAPGTYDIILYDSAQERFRLRDALTVSPANLPPTEIMAIGAFGNLDAAGAAKLTAGTTLTGGGEIVTVGKPVPDMTEVFAGPKLVPVPTRDALRLPAVVKLTCRIRSPQGSPFCQSGDVTIAPKSLVILVTPLGQTPFQIQRVRSTQPLDSATLSIRLRGLASVVSQVKTGDLDTGGVDNELGVLGRVESTGAIRAVAEGTSEVDVTVAANVQQSGSGWLYDSAPIRVGGAITLRSSTYEVSGIVTAITPRK